VQYLVVAYPRLDAADARWVQAIRQQYDPHAALIAPHFTLVFPTEIEDERRFLLDLRQQATPFAPFTFVIRCALPVKDLLSPSTHIFLVPDEGLSSLVRLHDALYATSLAPALRLDIPFIPHITVGAIGEPVVAKAIADAVNLQERVVEGVIDQLSLIRFDGRAVELREQIALGHTS
jgi:2'-5' RNA ligase